MATPLTFATASFERAEAPTPSPLHLAMLGAQRDGPVSTFGWDSVYTIKIDNINRQLREDRSTPKGFDSEIDEQNTARAEFGTWQIAATGDGKLINFELPLKQVTVTRGDRDVVLPDAVATVQVELEFVPHKPVLGAGPHTEADDMVPHELVIKRRVDAPPPMLLGGTGFSSAAEPARVFPLAFATGAPTPGMMDKTIVEVALSQWLNDNLDQFAYVFASVNLANTVSKDAFGWLKPTYASYAFQSGNDQTDPQLAILCMSEQRPASHLYSVVADGALTQDEDSGTFIISGTRLLDQMIRNALPTAFKGLKRSDGVLSKDGRALTVNKTVHLTQVSHDGDHYDAELMHLGVNLDGEHLIVESHTETKVSPGVYSECSARSRFTLGLMELPDGNRTLHYELVDEATHHSTRHSTAVEIVKWILIVVGVIVGVVAAILTGGAAGILAAALVALVFGVLQYLPDMIAAINKNNAPPIDLLATNATDPIRWRSSTGFRLSDVQLNDSLLLTGVMATA